NAWGTPFAGVMHGAKLVFPGRYVDPESLMDLASAERVTFTGGVPTVWFAVIAALEQHPQRWKLDGMRVVIAGSAPPESLIRNLEQFGIRAIHPWGLTETSPICTTSFLKSHLRDAAPDEQYRLRAKQGIVAPFVDMRAVGDSGEIPWDGETMGEIQVRGPWIAENYFKQPEAHAEKWTEDGWFRTGD